MNDPKKYKAYQKAQKRIFEENNFYQHAFTYLVINIVLIFFKIEIGSYVHNEGYHNFLSWNLIITPIIWGLGLLGHGLWVFRKSLGLEKRFKKLNFVKEWEEKKIKEFMDNDS